MRLPIFSFLFRVLEAGTSKEMGFLEIQKTKMFNLFILLAFPIAVFSFIINTAENQLFLAFFNIIQITTFAFASWTNIKRKYLNLRPVYLFILAFVGLISVYYFKTGTEYRLLVMIIAAVVLFEKDWQYLLFATIVSVGFTATRIQSLTSGGATFQDIIIPMIKILIPLSMFNISLFYFKHIYFKSQIQLEIAFKELSLAKDQKDKILYTVAHDLRSPISSIVGICKVLLRDKSFSDDQIEWLHFIDKAATNSNSLITDLLQANDTNIQLADLKKMDLNLLIKKAVDLLFFKAKEKNIDLNIILFPEELFIVMDPEKLQRVFVNLINNAIKFSKPNSNVLIHIDRIEGDAKITIKDSGIGIALENQQLVFDMFTTAKRAGTVGEKSFGLGLSICKQIIEHHSGTIKVISELNKGAEFIVRLPANFVTIA